MESRRGGNTITAHRFDLKTRKTDKLVENILAFYVSANGEKMLYRHRRNRRHGRGRRRRAEVWTIAALPPAPPSGAAAAPAPARRREGALNLASMEVRVDPVAEWKQIYHEAFRLERDYFYDPGFHGLDLAATRKEVRDVSRAHRVAHGFELPV